MATLRINYVNELLIGGETPQIVEINEYLNQNLDGSYSGKTQWAEGPGQDGPYAYTVQVYYDNNSSTWKINLIMYEGTLLDDFGNGTYTAEIGSSLSGSCVQVDGGGNGIAGTRVLDDWTTNTVCFYLEESASSPTFITSKLTGETISVGVFTTTGYWKYNHNSTDSNVFSNVYESIEVLNANGEFTLISCDDQGNVSGDITNLNLGDPDNSLEITSFDGTELTSLATLALDNNSISSFDNFTFPTSLTTLSLSLNQLTGFTGTGLINLTDLNLYNNPLISFNGGDMISLTSLDIPNIWGTTTLQSFDGGNMTGLTSLNLGSNQLTSFDGTGLTSLNYLDLNDNQLTSLEGFVFPTSLINLYLNTNQLTSLEGFVFPTSLTGLYLYTNQLTSFDGTELINLITLDLSDNQLSSINVAGLNSLQNLYVNNNQLTPQINDSLLSLLSANELNNYWNFGEFYTTGGRTSAGTTDYDYLISNGWTVDGADLVITGSRRVGIRRRNP
jgi:Leucine Rich repeats (2 copies)